MTTAKKPSKRFSPLAFTAPTAEEQLPAVVPSGRPDVSPFQPPAVVPPRPRDATAPSGQDATAPSGQDATAPSGPDGEAPRPQDVATPARPDVVTSRRSAFTWRLTVDEADRLDTLVLELRRTIGRGRLDRAAMLQALVDLTSERQDVKEELAKRLLDA